MENEQLKEQLIKLCKASCAFVGITFLVLGGLFAFFIKSYYELYYGIVSAFTSLILFCILARRISEFVDGSLRNGS